MAAMIVSPALMCIEGLLSACSPCFETEEVFLETVPGRTNALAERIFSELSPVEKAKVSPFLTQLAERGVAVETDTFLLTRALRRAGFLSGEGLHRVRILGRSIGEGGIGSSSFFFRGALDAHPETGHIGFINGMCNLSHDVTRENVVRLSERYARGHNVHVTYLATHQVTDPGDVPGIIADVFRMLASNAGHYTRTSVLLAQKWIDYFHEHPMKKFLQIGHSEGAAHIHAALRLIREIVPELLDKLCIVAFCPAYFMSADDYAHPEDEERKPQIISFVKKEDGAIIPWGRNSERIGIDPTVHIIEHADKHDPHDFWTPDYVRAGTPFFEKFFETGYIY